MDAFFAAIEERNNPHLKGKPIVVGADPKEGRGRGVVSTANYAARKYGIHSAMPISQAWQLCPQAIFLPVDYKTYQIVSDRLTAILQSMREKKMVIEKVGIDEFYFDVSSLNSWTKAKNLARKIKAEIYDKEKLTCSIGIGPNKLIAKIASDRQKPDGLTIVRPKEVDKFLGPLGIEVIPGVGPKTALFLESRGIKLVEDLRQIPKDELKRWLGKWGEELYEKAQGRDERQVGEREETKSIGEQETFETDTLKQTFIVERLMKMAESVWQTLRQEGFLGRTVAVIVRFADFETKTRSKTRKEPIRDLSAFKTEVLRLVLPFFDRRENPRGKKIRLVGLRAEKLVSKEKSS